MMLNSYVVDFCQKNSFKIKTVDESKIIQDMSGKTRGKFKLSCKYVTIDSIIYKKSDLLLFILEGVTL